MNGPKKSEIAILPAATAIVFVKTWNQWLTVPKNSRLVEAETWTEKEIPNLETIIFRFKMLVFLGVYPPVN